jgi:hypothetical protein
MKFIFQPQMGTDFHRWGKANPAILNPVFYICVSSMKICD